MLTHIQLIWLVWLTLSLTLVVTTLVTTMADRPKQAFYSVMLLVLVGFSAPFLHKLGLVSLPLSADVVKEASMEELINIVFAAPQILAAVVLISLYLAMHFLGYAASPSSSFFVFVKPFYYQQYFDVTVDEVHIRTGSRGNGFTTPLALALEEAISDHGFKPLYVFANEGRCKVVTNEFTLEFSPSKRAKQFFRQFNQYRPVTGFSTSLKITSVKLDPSTSKLHWLTFGLLGGTSSR